MDAARALSHARKHAGLTQRDLARRVGVPQPVIARVESRGVVPRVDTLDRLLSGCGQGLESRPRLGVGVDRTAIRELLALTPGERARLAADEARHVAAALEARRRSDPGGQALKRRTRVRP